MAESEDDLAHCDWLGVVTVTDSAADRLTLCVSLPDDELLTGSQQFVDDVTPELVDC